MRLAAAGTVNGRRGEGDRIGRRAIRIVDRAKDRGGSGNGGTAIVPGSLGDVKVGRDFVDTQSMDLLPTILPQNISSTEMDGNAALQIGQREVSAAIAAISCAEQGKESLILHDGQ